MMKIEQEPSLRVSLGLGHRPILRISSCGKSPAHAVRHEYYDFVDSHSIPLMFNPGLGRSVALE